MKQKVTITEADAPTRADKYIASLFPEYSRAALAKLFTLNLIKKDGTPIPVGERVRPGDIVEYDLGPLQEKPEVIPLPVVYEDNNVIVVNKPVGIISHARGKFWQEASVASFIRDKVSNDDSSERAGIVHRLDRATSGLMICAKNPETMKFLQRQFHDRRVKKTYCAVIQGSLEHKTATVDAPIMRNLKDPKRFMVHKDGKHAVTDYEVVSSNSAYSVLKLTPKTGRTHQLRLHMLHLGKPIVGDDLYGGEAATRLMLHAHTLTLMVSEGVEKTFVADLPAEFSEFMR